MIGYLLPVTCPACGGALEAVTEGKVIRNRSEAGTETRAIMRCTDHGSHPIEFVVEVFLRPVRDHHAGAPCGTDAGYQRHLRAHEDPCGACSDAHAAMNNPEQRPPANSREIPEWEERRIERRVVVAELLGASS